MYKHVDPDLRKQAKDTRHLAKYVFPRQFGLKSPFALDEQSLRKETYKFPDFADREEEIKVWLVIDLRRSEKSELDAG